ncbi:MAG: hypothetical protein H6711_24055 [Myxococcales bacterium]|nr:hypothetical protein [Myxococcales bacterium]
MADSAAPIEGVSSYLSNGSSRSAAVILSIAWVVACSGGGPGEGESEGAFSSGASASTGSASASTSGGESDSAAGSSGGGSESASASGTSGASTSASTGASDGSTGGATDTSASTSASGTTTGAMSGGDTSSGGVVDTTTGGIPPSCGDGIVDVGEECDDGDQNGVGMACNPDCTLNVCGDGVEGPTEECDLGPDNGPDGGCSAECTINPSSCGVQNYAAELVISPVDIIITIDNSGSMGAEIKGVQDNINQNFAGIIEGKGLDYRVILVSRHGPYNGPESVCIEAPLSGIPQGGCVNPPPKPVNKIGKFYHYSVEIGSHNAWCRLLDTFDGSVPDEFNFAPNGWQEWLRVDSVKTFIAISDDGTTCGAFNDGNSVNAGKSTAAAYDAALQALSPLHFGDSPDNRNYNFYSIVGMAYNNPKTDPYLPLDPVITGKCPTAADPGTGHQSLSVLTDALRFPICDTTSYDVVFQGIADGVIKSAKIACEFPVPPPPENKTLDLDSVLLEYTPMGMGDPKVFMQVPGIDQCGPMAFYIEGDTVHLCPEACDAVQADKSAKIDINFACEPLNPG